MPNNNMSPEIPQNPEKPKFEKSWLVDSEEELKKLRSGELGTAGKKIAMLHITGLTNTLNADQLAERAAKWGEEAVEEGDEVWPELTPYIIRTTEKVKTMSEKPEAKKQENENLNPINQLVEIQQRELNAELQEIIAGQDAFFRSIYFQSSGSTELGKETWYNSLPQSEQVLLNLQNKFLFALTGTDSMPGKKAGPIKGFDIYKNFLHIRKEEGESLFRSEGFQIAFGTIVHDLFEYGELNPDRKSQEPVMYGLVLSNKGKDIIRDQDKDTQEQKFNIYRESLVEKIGAYLSEHRDQIEFGLLNHPNLTREMINRQIKVASEAYFGIAWNFLSVGNAIESGDSTRKVSSSDPTVIVPSWRNMIHPHDQAKNKWVKGQAEKIGTEEDLFGILGRWFQERIRHDPEFKNRFEAYSPGFRYFQRVTAGSMFDHSYFTDNTTTLSQVFTNSQNINKVAGHDLYRFTMPPQFSFSKLRDSDIGYVYTDILDSVIKIQTLITTPEPIKDAQAAFALFIGALQSLQGRSYDPEKKLVLDKVLSYAYEPDEIEDLIIAGIGAAAGGFKQYTNQLMLEVPGVGYDRFLFDLLKDDRIYKILGANPGSSKMKNMREKIYHRLNAHDINTWFGADRSTKDSALMGGPRTKIVKEIQKNRARWS